MVIMAQAVSEGTTWDWTAKRAPGVRPIGLVYSMIQPRKDTDR